MFSPEFFGTIAVQLVGYGMLVQTVRDHTKMLNDHEDRLREVEGRKVQHKSRAAAAVAGD